MNKLFICILTIFLTACRNSNLPRISTNPTTDSSFNFDVRSSKIEYLSSKSDFSFKDEKESLNAHATLRIKSDSIIWVNISAGLGIEALRATITQDSIVIVDKIKKQYVVYYYPDLSKKYNFNIDYALIQNLLVGNLLKNKSAENRMSSEGNHSVLTQRAQQSFVENYINQKTKNIEKVIISEPGTSNLLTIKYGSFTSVSEEVILPFNVSLDLNYMFERKKYNIQIDIDHQKVDAPTGLKFPLNIPAKYERRE